ncbi:MAG: phosphatase PAP2 family protein [Eubacteriales bacterium]
MNTFKQFYTRNRLLSSLLYVLFYCIGFFYIESLTPDSYHIIYTPLDSMIPFCEYFVIPYYLWFPYLIVGFLFLFFDNKKQFDQLGFIVFSGMTIFLIVSFLYPNAQELRPDIVNINNIFTQLVSSLYSIDTPTNIFPSIHVYDSIAIAVALSKNNTLQKYRWLIYLSNLLAISIVLATVFIKQHSILDGIGAFIMYLFFYAIVYTKQSKQDSAIK